MDINSLQRLSLLQSRNIAAGKEQSERVILEVSLPPAESQTFTCAGAALERSFFPEIEGCETLDYMVVITAYWLLFLSQHKAAVSRVPQRCAWMSEEKLTVHLLQKTLKIDQKKKKKVEQLSSWSIRSQVQSC